MEYTKEQFYKDVVTEATLIKKEATRDEINNLNASTFDPESYNNCVYGQMTGYCSSERATELIYNCCQRYFDMPKSNDFPIRGGFESISPFANGAKPAGVRNHIDLYSTRTWYKIQHFSALEAYIQLPGAKKSELISFLKNESDIFEP